MYKMIIDQSVYVSGVVKEWVHLKQKEKRTISDIFSENVEHRYQKSLPPSSLVPYDLYFYLFFIVTSVTNKCYV